MISKLKTIAVLTPLLLTPIACSDSSGPPPPPSASGQWAGTTSGGITLSVLLTEGMGGNLTGSGTFSSVGGVAAIDITGVHVFPNVSLTMTASGFESLNFSGLMNQDGTLISGTLNGSGFQGSAITIGRQ